jgi:hypothetical protein
VSPAKSTKSYFELQDVLNIDPLAQHQQEVSPSEFKGRRIGACMLLEFVDAIEVGRLVKTSMKTTVR